MINNTVNVICATYNQSVELEKTIKSFSEQSYNNKRLIIIDGNSTDGFNQIADNYQTEIDYYISEDDDGISDAFNKGVKQCIPGYVFFLGAGDKFFSNESLSELVKDVDYKSDLLVCGKVRRKDLSTNEVIGITPKSLSFDKKSLLFKMSLPHQGLLTSTLYFEEFGLFRESCKYAMDYDLLLRAYKSFPKVILKETVVADWMTGGVGADNTLGVFKEYNRIKIDNNVSSKPILMMINAWTVFKYKIKKAFLRE